FVRDTELSLRRGIRRRGHIDRSSREAPSPLGPTLCTCHPRPVNGYLDRLAEIACPDNVHKERRRVPLRSWPGRPPPLAGFSGLPGTPEQRPPPCYLLPPACQGSISGEGGGGCGVSEGRSHGRGTRHSCTAECRRVELVHFLIHHPGSQQEEPGPASSPVATRFWVTVRACSA